MTWTVGNVMSRPAATVQPTTTFKKCVDFMRIQQVSAVPVVTADGKLVGILSEADLMRNFERPDGGTPPTAADMMTRNVVTIRADASVAAAARIMVERGVKRLPVRDPAGRVIGVVSRVDVLRVFLRSDESIRKEISNGLLNELPLLGRGRIQVEVVDGVVRLSGDMDNGPLTGLLLRLVAAVAGVVGVENRLRPVAASNEPRAPVARHA
jgi:CBS domain-containing protein